MGVIVVLPGFFSDLGLGVAALIRQRLFWHLLVQLLHIRRCNSCHRLMVLLYLVTKVLIKLQVELRLALVSEVQTRYLSTLLPKQRNLVRLIGVGSH